MPVPTVTVRFSRSSSLILFIRFTSTTMPPRSGTAPSVSPVPPSRGTTGTRSSLAMRTTPATSSVLVGQHGEVGQPLGPAVHRERRRHPRPVVAVGLGGEDLLVAQHRAQRGDELVEALDRDGHAAPLPPFVVRRESRRP